jgi:hypothetical protein
MRFSTARRAATGEVARSLLFTIVLRVLGFFAAWVLGRAMEPPLKWKKPRTAEPPEASSPQQTAGL